ncbi:hypothetical protein A2Z53_02180 [Candidatus Giovannonibacteria bacterium RIFCSPHIGHO2_02_42_15]|uniref:Polymer-forming cytoskeletal protein n=2 Tax=Candidatus Giovannoniibacteriota TaxID=1752738 RepID=A0A1F5VJV1_9BACT|nr:MAG: hypothetical protein UV11_C0002G0019 [Candidatus Giovannonibacteria bacterium GW2011_GWF2_42_19]OGF63743.1 MAG: hypothetical protein A2Z53_02180 [Candidatus Giovannonibacteria bacterium RIFCSPHIGHO2_02_42_15]
MTKQTLAYILALTLMAFAPILTDAADYLPKNKADGGNVNVAGDKDYKNLFVGGGNVSINKKILGDLFAAGGSVNIASPVEKDLFAAGGNMTISAAVGEDARLAGGNIIINSPVGGDLMTAGGTVNIGEAATIGGDFWSGAGILNLNSSVRGNAKLGGGEILINSEISGNVEIRADKKLVFGPKSKVLGEIVYRGSSEAVIQDGAQISQIEFHKIEKTRTASAKRIVSVFLLIKILALFVAALIALKLFGKSAHSIVSRPHTKPWVNLGIGFLGVIAIPIAALILLLTMLGFLAGLILIFSFVLALLFSSIFATLFIGSLAERWIFKKTEINLTWKTVIWGVVISAIISLIPIVGWIVMFIAYLMVFGSFLQEARTRLEI